MAKSIETRQKTPLKVAENLFLEFSKRSIRYCHWKSNEHLLEGLAGDTDLDVLVDRKHARQCEDVLTLLQYKRVLSQPWANYPGIEDWLGFDEQTGKLVHIHLHYRLWTGRQYVKERRLPWEQIILDSAIEDDQWQVMIANPNIEIILLVIRAVLKASYRDLLAAQFGHWPISGDVIRESEYLYARINYEQMLDYARRMLGDNTGALVAGSIQNLTFLNGSESKKLLRIVPRATREYRRYSRARTFLIYLRFAMYHRYLGILRRLGHRAVQGKTLHSGGAMVAIIGADGSGKSTVTAEIARWLSWKLSVQRVYLGTGDGDVGFALRALKGLATFRRRCITAMEFGGSDHHSDRERPTSSSLGQRLRGMVESLYCFLSARHRMRKVLLARTISGQGGIVVADRYPQSRISDIFDGPPSPPVRTSHIAKLMHKHICSYYQQMEQLPLDLVIRLNVSEEAALQRKPDHTIDEIRKKMDLFPSLVYTTDRLVDIDASQPLGDVVLDVKRIIWSAL